MRDLTSSVPCTARRLSATALAFGH